MIAINCFGTFGVHFYAEDEAQTREFQFRSDKVKALFLYLLLEEAPLSRGELASLLWAGQESGAARNNLRATLSRLRKTLAQGGESIESGLLTTRQTVALVLPPGSYRVDVLAFEEWVKQSEQHPVREWWCRTSSIQKLQQGMALYTGAFLDGLTFPMCESWNHWVEERRTTHMAWVMSALDALARHYLVLGESKLALAMAQRQLQEVPWLESAHRQAIESLAALDKREEAIDQYELCCQSLMEELGVSPTAATKALGVRIERLSTRTESAGLRSGTPPERAPFFGRSSELVKLKGLLLDPDYLLITVLGVGGTGKTRLSLKVTQQMATHFLDGGWFVSLAEVHPEVHEPAFLRELLSGVIGRVLNMSFHQQDSVSEQFLNYLEGKEMILLLDNFEHLLEGCGLLLDMMVRAPLVKLLVTSRQTLSLQSEYIFQLDGLDIGKGHQQFPASAIQLFEERMKRQRNDFAMTPGNTPAIQDLCRLLEGNPLGIELAAAQCVHQSPEKLHEALQQDILRLSVSWRDLPPRHRSMEALFEDSWRSLSAAQQAQLCQLSCIRGPFTCVLAEALFQIPAQELRAFVDASLLHKTDTVGEYRLHELLRQFFFRQLSQQPAFFGSTKEAYSVHYLGWVVEATPLLRGRTPSATLLDLQRKYDNIHQAWYWALKARSLSLLLGAIHGLRVFYEHFRLVEEAHQLCKDTTEALDTPSATDEERRLIGWCKLCRGHMFYVQTALEQSIAICRPTLVQAATLSSPMLELEAGLVLGAGLAISLSEQAAPHLQNTIAMAREAGSHYHLAGALLTLSYLELSTGALDVAQEHAQEGLALAEAHEHAWFEVMLSRVLSRATLYQAIQGHPQASYADAQRLIQQSIDVSKVMKHTWMEAFGHRNLGLVLVSMQQLEQAHAAYEESMELLRPFGVTDQLAETKAGLAFVRLQQGQHESALMLVQEVLSMPSAFAFRGAEEPTRILLYCCHVLAHHKNPMQSVLQQQLQETLQDFAETKLPPSHRHAFLHKLPHHQEILQLPPR